MPKPEKHVFVCVQNRGPGHPRGSCMQSGAGNLWDEFAYAFQQKNLNGRFALSNTGCLECGTCRIICTTYRNVDWEYPRGGYGILFKFG